MSTMTISLSDSMKTAIRIAQSFARENNNDKFGLAHLLRGLMHKEVGLVDMLKAMDKDTGYIIDWAEIKIEEYPKAGKMPENILADDKVTNVFEEADNIRLKLGLDDIEPVCVLAAIVKPNIGFTA